MTGTFTLAHLSDLHLGPLPAFGLQHWNLKRALGFANWHRNRKGAHDPGVAGRLVADLKTQAPNHIAVTGDLINIGLPAEYQAALAWLKALGSSDVVTVIPGNHDIYCRLRRDPGVGRWQAYMRSNGADPAEPWRPEAAFPFVRQLGHVALIALNSAVPTPPFVAAGHLGQRQLTRLAELLDRARQDGLVRVVLIHHPPLPGQATRMKALRDAADLQALLARHGAELVLHGHNHRSERRSLDGPDGVIPIIGVPSASLGHPHKEETLARYHLFRIEPTSQGVRITLTARGLPSPDGPVVEIERQVLAG